MKRSLSVIGLTLTLATSLAPACGGETQSEPSQSVAGEAGDAGSTPLPGGGHSGRAGGTISGGAPWALGGRAAAGGAPGNAGGRVGAGGRGLVTGGAPNAFGGAGFSGEAGSGGAGFAGDAGSGGAGAASGDECTLAPDGGPCDAFFPAYYHDAETGVCRPFVYGGCQGNVNRYDTLEACQAACHGGSPNFDACETGSDCIVTSAACCAQCEPVTAHAFIAIHRLRERDVKGECQVACGACPEPDPNSVPVAPNYLAACVEGECRLLDLRETPAAECEVDDDCALRDGSRCCETCGGNPVALSDEPALRGLLECVDLACPPCEPVFDSTHRAVCDDGRCVVAVEP